MVKAGETVEIRDSQTGEDLTRTVLTQIMIERQPEKMSLFPSDMLHFIVRSNEVMSDFLRDYFRHSLTYLRYLQRHSHTTSFAKPMHWVQAWLDSISKTPPDSTDAETPAHDTPPSPSADTPMSQRIQELEERIRQLESKDAEQ